MVQFVPHPRIAELFRAAYNEMADIAQKNSEAHGFWAEGQSRNRPEMLCLIHSEISECLEGLRKPAPSDHIPDFTLEEEELADAVIRIMDYGAGFNLRVAEAVLAKMTFNATRPFKHGKKC